MESNVKLEKEVCEFNFLSKAVTKYPFSVTKEERK